jgi:hypothetical protein
VRPRSEVEGYLAQRAAHALLEEAGLGRPGGWKVGCTTATMQAYLGVGGPVAEAMFRGNMWYGRSLGTPTPVADDFFHYGCVLGDEVEIVGPGNLALAAAAMTVNQWTNCSGRSPHRLQLSRRDLQGRTEGERGTRGIRCQ